MTGFARVRRAIEQGEIVVSLKSVNHRGLDLHFHLPAEFDAVENEIRSVIKKGVGRGHMQVNVTYARTAAGAASLNRELFQLYLTAFREAAAQYGIAGQPDVNSALRVPGMLGAAGSVDSEVPEAVLAAAVEVATEAVTVLNVFREREGAALAAEIVERCGKIESLVARMEEIRTGAVPAFQKRLREKLDDLLRGTSLDPQRIAQEAAILADRSDISEELVRLKTHTAHLAHMMETESELGKRLDFLLQEMNRESNTILSKTGGIGDLGLTLTDLALAAKSEIEKIREQSLNLE
jgi:uncharacterized protein (TIGR00255 family)